jgi:hypothetical protein
MLENSLLFKQNFTMLGFVFAGGFAFELYVPPDRALA